MSEPKFGQLRSQHQEAHRAIHAGRAVVTTRVCEGTGMNYLSTILAGVSLSALLVLLGLTARLTQQVYVSGLDAPQLSEGDTPLLDGLMRSQPALMFVVLAFAVAIYSLTLGL